MAEKLLTQDEWEILLRSWKMGHGVLNEQFGYQVPPNSPQRIEMYEILVTTLIKEHGYDCKDLRDKRCFERIINSSVNLKHKHKKKLQDWKDFATKDLHLVIDSYFAPAVTGHKIEKIQREPNNKVALAPPPVEIKKTAEKQRIRSTDIKSGFKPVSVIESTEDFFDSLIGGNENE